MTLIGKRGLDRILAKHAVAVDSMLAALRSRPDRADQIAEAYLAQPYPELLAPMIRAGLACEREDTLKERGKAMFKKLSAVIVLVGLVALQGCASTGGAKAAGYQGLTIAGQALFLIQDTEMGMVCGRAGAPVPPACVSETIHKNEISPRLAKAFGVGEKASAALRALPPTISASPTPEIFAFVAEIWGLVDEIRALIPQSSQSKQLASSLDGLAAKK